MDFFEFIVTNLLLSFADALSQEYIPKYHFLHSFNIAVDANNRFKTNPISK